LFGGNECLGDRVVRRDPRFRHGDRLKEKDGDSGRGSIARSRERGLRSVLSEPPGESAGSLLRAGRSLRVLRDADSLLLSL